MIVLKPLIGSALTYAVPDDCSLERGDLVLVPFGRLAVWGVVEEADTDPGHLSLRKIKPVDSVLATAFFPHQLLDFGIQAARNQFQPLGDLFMRFLPPEPESVLKLKYSKSDTPPADDIEIWKKLPEKPITRASLAAYLRRFKIRKSISGLLGSGALKITVSENSSDSRTVPWTYGEGYSETWTPELPGDFLGRARETQVLVEFPSVAQIDRFLDSFTGVPVYHHYSQAGRKAVKTAWKAARSGFPGLHLAVHNGPFLPLPRLSGIVVMDEANPGHITRDRLALDIREICILRARAQRVTYVAVSRVPRLYLVRALARSFPTAKPESLIPLPKAQVYSFLKDRRRSPHITKSLYEQLQRHWMANQKVAFLVTASGEGYPVCASCRGVPKCLSCGRTLRWSEDRSRLICSFCRVQSETVPKECAECGGSSFRTVGVTTKRVLRELQKLVPEVLSVSLPVSRYARIRDLKRFVEEFVAREGAANIVATPAILQCDLSPFPVRVVVRGDSFWSVGDYVPPEWGIGIIARFLDGSAHAYLQVDGPGFSAVTAFKEGNLRAYILDEYRTRESLEVPPFSAILEVGIPAKTQAEASRRFRQWRARVGLPATDGVQVFGPAPGARTRFGLEYVWWLKTKSPAEIQSFYSAEALATSLRKLPVRWQVTYR